MTLLLSEEDVRTALDMREAIDALDLAFRALDAGDAVNRPRSHSYSRLPDGSHHLFKTMDGAVLPLGIHALRLSSDLVVEQRSGSGIKRVKLPAAPGSRYVGLVMLFSIDELAPIAIMPDGYLQRMRVGATSALAARHLARPGARTAAIIGTGWQAGAQLLGLSVDRALEAVRVFGPTPEHVDSFVEEHSSRLGLEITVAEDSHHAIDGADIVALSTNSMEPVIDGAWLAPGQHIGSVQGYEIDDATLERADLIAVRSLEPSTYHHAPGRAPLEVEAEPELSDHIMAKMVELGSVVAGRSGRSNPDQVTLFTGSHTGASSGLGIQFAAVGHAVLERARAMSLGNELPTEWFTQAGRP